ASSSRAANSRAWSSAMRRVLMAASVARGMTSERCPRSAGGAILALDGRVVALDPRHRRRLAVGEVVEHRRARLDRVAGGDRPHDPRMVLDRLAHPVAVAQAGLELLLVQVLDRLHDAQ